MPLSGPGGGFGAPGSAPTHPGSGGLTGRWASSINWTDLAFEFGQGAYGAYSARQANRAARRASQKQMDFQERMSNTAYQRSAADLEKAGLNRILALGQPATTPGGAQPPKLEVQGRHVREGIATALQMGLIKAQIRRTDAETAFTKSKTGIADPIRQGAEVASQAVSTARGAAKKVIQELEWGPPTGTKAKATPSLQRRQIEQLAKTVGLDPEKVIPMLQKVLKQMDLPSGWSNDRRLAWALQNPQKIKQYLARQRNRQ